MSQGVDQTKQEANVHGSDNIIVQAGDGSQVTVGDRPHLVLIPPRNLVPELRTTIDLLNPYRRAFDLVGRENEPIVQLPFPLRKG